MRNNSFDQNIQNFQDAIQESLAMGIYKMTTISLSPTHNIFLDKSPLDCISSINIFIVHMIASLDQIILLHLVQNKCFIFPLNQVSDESMWLCISACMCYTSAGLPFLVRSECLRQGAAAGLCRVFLSMPPL